jgi:hypothetical protein
LNHRIAESIPKGLGVFGQCRTPGDEGPKLPAEARVNPSEPPPAPQKVGVFCGFKILAKPLASAFQLELALDFALQRLDESGHRDEHRNAFAADGVDHACGLQRLAEDHGADQQRRDEHA